MPMLTAEMLPLPSAQSGATSDRGKPLARDGSAPVALVQRGSDASDTPDPSYWTAYDHYMVEREARAMRRVYVWTLLARAWAALGPALGR
jgi:hypothetical protein